MPVGWPRNIAPPGQDPIWEYPEATRPRPEPRAVTGGYTESIPEIDDVRLRALPGAPMSGDWAGRREVGNWVHRNFEQINRLLLRNAERLINETLPPRLVAEYTIPDITRPYHLRYRVDRIDWQEFVVYEIKPARWRRKAEAQARKYAAEMDRIYPLRGRNWEWRVVTYDMERVIDMLIRIGYFTRQSLGLPIADVQTWMTNRVPRQPPVVPPVFGPPAPPPAAPPGDINVRILEGGSAAEAEAAAAASKELTHFMRPEVKPPKLPPGAGDGGAAPAATAAHPPVAVKAPASSPEVPIHAAKPPPAEAPVPTAKPAPAEVPIPAAKAPAPPAEIPGPAAKPAAPRATPAPTARPAMSGGAVAFNVVTALPGLLNMARDMRIESQQPISLGPAYLEDAGGTYTIGWADNWTFNDYWKTYVSGPRAGERIPLTASEWAEEESKVKAKYGYFNVWGQFIHGEIPPTYYSGIPPERA
jgi:hypothetical protein